MATTSPDAAFDAVAAIEEAKVSFAVLHGEAALARREVDSDIDVVSDRPVYELVRASTQHWAAVGLYPLIVWPYDVGGTGSVFLTTQDAQQGVQLDFLHDPSGRGRYGARSDRLLDVPVAGRRFTTVAPGEQMAYLLAKRIGKGDPAGARRLVEGASSRDIALDVLRPDIADVVRSFVENGTTPRGWDRRPAPGHFITRLLRPAGGWVELRGKGSERVATELTSRFARFLPHARCIASPHFAGWATSVAPVRWRAGLVASYGPRSRIAPRPDLSIDGPVSTDEAAARIVARLAGRYTHPD
jgi:hypothetical protein